MFNKIEHRTLLRQNDIIPIHDIVSEQVTVTIDGNPVIAYQGESVLSTLLSLNIRNFSQNDHGAIQGAYCGMGVCYCCMVKINGNNKQRACQHSIEKNMTIDTLSNHFTTLAPVLKKSSFHE